MPAGFAKVTACFDLPFKDFVDSAGTSFEFSDLGVEAILCIQRTNWPFVFVSIVGPSVADVAAVAARRVLEGVGMADPPNPSKLEISVFPGKGMLDAVS